MSANIKYFDIILVGNGILSYSIAFALSQKDPKLKIAIIGPRNKLSGASTAAGVMLNCFAEITSSTFSSAESKAKFDMAYRALKLWPEWIRNLNQYLSKPLEIRDGTYVLLNSQSGTLDTNNFYCIKNALKNYNEYYEEISPRDVPGINPLASHRPLQALYIPHEGSIDPNQVIGSLHNILQTKFNVKIIDAAVKKVNYKNFSVHGVTLESGQQINAGKVVLAAGVYTQNLINQIPEIRYKIPLILSGAGYSILMKSESHGINHVIRTPNRAGACGLHALPRDKKTLYIGATNNLFIHPQHNISMGLAKFLLECAMEQIDQDFYQAEIKGWLVGNRPVTLDTFPLIGKTSIKGLVLSTGTYRDGFHLSPYLANYIIPSILTENSEKDAVFTPERSLIQTMSITESTEEYLSHYISGAYEHGTKLPLFLREKKFLAQIKNKIDSIYDLLGIDFGLTPEVILMISLSDDPGKPLNGLKEYFSKMACAA